MKFTLHIWRQENARAKGHFETYPLEGISPDCSFLEMLDILNEQLINDHIAHPVCFDNDCREGICGMCGLYINGRPHGNDDGITTCQLHMRKFHDGDDIWIEPWRAKPFPVIRDLVVDRSAFDKIIQAGGYISTTTGGVPDANTIPIPKHKADMAMDAASCIGCGLWVPRSAIWLCCRKGKSRLPTAYTKWFARWTSWALAAAPIPTPARPNARNSSSGRTSHGSTDNGLERCWEGTGNKRIARFTFVCNKTKRAHQLDVPSNNLFKTNSIIKFPSA